MAWLCSDKLTGAVNINKRLGFGNSFCGRVVPTITVSLLHLAVVLGECDALSPALKSPGDRHKWLHPGAGQLPALAANSTSIEYVQGSGCPTGPRGVGSSGFVPCLLGAAERGGIAMPSHHELLFSGSLPAWSGPPEGYCWPCCNLPAMPRAAQPGCPGANGRLCSAPCPKWEAGATGQGGFVVQADLGPAVSRLLNAGGS